MTRASDTAKLLGAGATILDGTTISTADNTTQLTLTSTDADANVGPSLNLYRNSASPADADLVGNVRFQGENSAGETIDYVTINGRVEDVTDGTEDARIDIRTITAGADVSRLKVDNNEIVLNDSSIDSDFRVESNGNANMLFVDGGQDRVGINNNNPQATLHIDGSLRVQNLTSGEQSNATIMASTAGNSALRFADADDINIGKIDYNHADNSMAFDTNNTERLRILTGGNVLINSTTLPVVGTEKLGVQGGSASNGVAIGGVCSHNTGIPLHLSNVSNTTNTFLARFSTGSGGSTRGEIYFNGSALVYATSSDYRLKQNINYDFDATTKLKQLKPAEYRWIEHQKDDIGFLAHEVQEVFPNAVGGEKDEVNDDGSIKPQTYDPSKLVPLLTKTILELEARITALES